MYYLYLDESGDLGFDYRKSKCSKYFTICILVVKSIQDNKILLKAIKKTLKSKINNKTKKVVVEELKGSKTSIKVKEYFWKQVKDLSIEIYAFTVNKSRINVNIRNNRQRFYNWVSRMVLEKIPIKYHDVDRLEIIIDKSKGKAQIIEFNDYIKRNLEAKIHPETKLDIYHWDSKQNLGLQACDLFCWGIHAKHEYSNTEWYEIYRKKIKFNEVYLKQKERAM